MLLSMGMGVRRRVSLAVMGRLGPVEPEVNVRGRPDAAGRVVGYAET